MTPRHLARIRAERLATKLGGPPSAASRTWRLKAKISYVNGGFANCYASTVDRRISALLTVERPGAKAKTVYAFTESEWDFKSLTDVAMAVLADDDDLAWESAGEKVRAIA